MNNAKNKVVILVMIFSLVMCTFSIFTFSGSKYVTDNNGDYSLNLLVFDPDYKCISEGENAATIYLTNLYPGMDKTYSFSVTNNSAEIDKLVLPIQYSLNLVSYGNLPLKINVYKDDVKIDKLCHDHTNNLSIMQTFSAQLMESNVGKSTDNYTLQIKWDLDKASHDFSTEVEYLTIFCSAWQN